MRLVLRRLARRYQFLSTEIRLADAELRGLITTAAPDMVTRLGVEVTGQLLTTVGDNPDRMRSEAAFAHRYVARELYQALVRLPASSSSWPAHRLERVGQP